MKSCFFNYITELFKKYLIKNDKLDDVNTQNTIQDSTTTESDQVSINEQVLQMDNSKEKHSYSKADSIMKPSLNHIASGSVYIILKFL